MRLIGPGTTQQPRHSEEVAFFFDSHADDPFRQDENGHGSVLFISFADHLPIVDMKAGLLSDLSTAISHDFDA
jgi:hypothetical protein